MKRTLFAVVLSVSTAFPAVARPLKAAVIKAELDATYAKPRPAFSDPVAQQYAAAFALDQQGLTSNPAAYFPPVDGANACPELSEEVVTAILGTIASPYGMATPGTRVEGYRFRVVDGDCGGGLMRIVAVHDEVIQGYQGDVIHRNHIETEVRAAVQGGALNGPFRAYRRSQLVVRQEQIRTTPELEAIAEGIKYEFIYGSVTGERWDGPIVGFMFQPSTGAHWTMLREQLEPAVEKQTGWDGGNPSFVYHYKNGVMHGEVEWPGRTFNGKHRKGTISCYVEGQLPKDARCDGPQVLDAGQSRVPSAVGHGAIGGMAADDGGEGVSGSGAGGAVAPPQRPVGATAPPGPAATATPAPQPAPTSTPEPADDIEARLLKLKALHDKGLISAEDYEEKKAELLESL